MSEDLHRYYQQLKTKSNSLIVSMDLIYEALDELAETAQHETRGRERAAQAIRNLANGYFATSQKTGDALNRLLGKIATVDRTLAEADDEQMLIVDTVSNDTPSIFGRTI